MVADESVNDGVFLQASHLLKAEHSPIPWPKRQVPVFRAFVQRSVFLAAVVANNFLRYNIRSDFVAHDDMRPTCVV